MEFTLDQALKKGIEAHKAGKVQEADRYYTAILKANPKHPDANHNMGVLGVDVGQIDAALPFFKKALQSNPNIDQFWLSYIDALIKLDRKADARALFNKAKSKGLKGDGFDQLELRLNSPSLKVKNETQENIATRPNIPVELKLDKELKIVKKKAKDGLSEEAKKILGGKTLATSPHIKEPSKEELNSLINLYNQKKLQQVYSEAQILTKRYTKNLALWNLMGASAAQLGKLNEAVLAFKKALSIKPDDAQAHYNLGNVIKNQGKLEEAMETYKKALLIKPDYAEAYLNMGNVFNEQEKFEEAIEAYNKALSIKPDYADAYVNMGNVLTDQEKLEEAIEAYNNALSIEPDNAEAHYNMGNALKEQEKLEEAIEAYNKALSIKPDYAEALSNMGLVLQEQSKLEEATQAFNKALAIKPDFAEAYNNMGSVLQEQSKLEEAIQAFNKALAIKPDYAEAWLNGAEALEKWNKLNDLEIWLEKAFGLLEVVPADLQFMKAKLLWRKKKYEETSNIIEDIKFETISEICRQDYLSLKAKIFEKFRKFDEAFACFTQNNLLVKESKEYKKYNPEQYFQNLRDSLDKLKSGSRINSKSTSVENTEFSPTFLVGFPRSGTTLLDTILRSNSKIEVVEEKGMLSAAESFLKKNGHNVLVGALIPSQLNLEAQKIYRTEFNKYINTTLADKVYIDKLPLNLLQASLIHQIYPAAKFILALRHPMDTILSCWMQNFLLNSAMANMVDLDRIVEFYCIAMETFKICRTNYNLNVHEIRYEDLINNLQKESTAVLEFVNLQWEPKMENYQDTAIKRGRINTPSYSQVIQPIYKDAQYRWHNYRKYLEQYVDPVKPWILEFGYD